jgi:hypothetical protein
LEFVKFEYCSSDTMNNLFARLAWRLDRFNHVVSGSLSARLAVLLLQEPVEHPLSMKTG